MRVVICTGGFDPLHSGHLAYFKAAKQLGDLLIVGVNSDSWLACKKGQAFMSQEERLAVIRSINTVDQAQAFDDSDGSALALIADIRSQYPHAELIFANGGDRTQDNIPETASQDPRLTFAFAVGGGTKTNSSSSILARWRTEPTKRPWGYYRVLDQQKGYKVKTLVVQPQQRLSMQRHQQRKELWQIIEGTARVLTLNAKNQTELKGIYSTHSVIKIARGEWHQLINVSDSDALIIVEIQIGTDCEEWDIERLD